MKCKYYFISIGIYINNCKYCSTGVQQMLAMPYSLSDHGNHTMHNTLNHFIAFCLIDKWPLHQMALS